MEEYSEFRLLQRLGLLFGLRILYFTIVWDLGKKWLFFGVLAICRYSFGVTFKTDYFWEVLSKFLVFLGVF